MEALLGFEIGFWDYVTFAALFFITATFLTVAVLILGLPGRIAVARNHPEADAVSLMGWVGFLAVVPWINALIWAFKPTDVIDVRRLPAEVRRETDAMIAHMTGKEPSTPAPLPAEVRRETDAMIAHMTGKQPSAPAPPPAQPSNQSPTS